jgi:hypothetical protein
MQIIKVKEDFPAVNLIIYGGAEAPAVSSYLRHHEDTGKSC